VRTPYGEPSGPLTFGVIGTTRVVFLARHGYGHTLAPHEINNRANLWALHARGVTHVVAICTVGGIAPSLGSGTIVIPDQIHRTTLGAGRRRISRAHSNPVTHIDFTYPYSEEPA
jgi:5'-methylthioadenosine phosphorylase